MDPQSGKRIFILGTNDGEVLGLGDQAIDKFVPHPTELKVDNVTWAQIAYEFLYAAAISSNGEVFTWGHGWTYVLGHGDQYDRKVPTRVEGLSGETIVKVACGTFHMAAVSITGKLFTWYVTLIK